MGFQGQQFAYDSPAAAVAAMIARLGRARPATEVVELSEAAGRILATPAAADRDSPAFDYASMDGYAVRCGDLRLSGLRRLPVAGESRIGQAPPDMPKHAAAVRIATGAAIPSGADAVIRREDVTEKGASREAVGSGVTEIEVASAAIEQVKPGQFIRRRGENARAGECVAEAGTLLSAAALGTLASIAHSRPVVYAPLKVVLISTGDELAAPDQPSTVYQVRDSNLAAIAGALSAHHWIHVVGTHRVADERELLIRTLRGALAECDALVTTGGVSMGHRDPIRDAIESVGAQVVFHGVPQRPGKPMLGAVVGRTGGAVVPLFGLPGNPLSSLVTFIRIVMPVLAARAGVSRLPEPASVSLDDHDGRAIDLWWHRLVRLTGPGRARLCDERGSGDVIAGARSDGFVEVPPGRAAAAGEGPLAFYPWP